MQNIILTGEYKRELENLRTRFSLVNNHFNGRGIFPCLESKDINP